MRALVQRQISAPQFARQWAAANARSSEAGERVRGPLYDALTRVFYGLEDYAEDPDLRDPEELDDEGLIEAVRLALSRLSSS
jgi:hypothetical protein